jgi:redox-sensitive bicupin YhaK (pirin superfamily)
VLSVLKANEREHTNTARGVVWTTRHAERTSKTDGRPRFRAILEEVQLPRGMPLVHPFDADSECFTYVREGRLAYKGPGGQTGVLSAGEFQSMTLGPGDPGETVYELHSERARVFRLQMWTRGVELEPLSETERITVAQRRGGLHLVASPGGRDGSVAIRSGVDVHSAVLHRGSHVAHALQEGRSAWLHVVDGAITMGDVELRVGDGVGVSDAVLLSLSAVEDSEILVIELHAGTR